MSVDCCCTKGEIGDATAQKAVLKNSINTEEEYFRRDKRIDIEFLLSFAKFLSTFCTFLLLTKCIKEVCNNYGLLPVSIQLGFYGLKWRARQIVTRLKSAVCSACMFSLALSHAHTHTSSMEIQTNRRHMP